MTSRPATTTSPTAWSGVGALATALEATVSIGLGPGADAAGPHLVVVDGGAIHPDTAAGLLAAAAAGHRVVVAAAPGSDLGALGVTLGDRPLGRQSADDPLVVDTRLTVQGTGPLAGVAVEADDLTAVTAAAGDPLLVHGGEVVAARLPVGHGTLDVIGSAAWLRNRWLSAADNAAALARLLGPGRAGDDGRTDTRAAAADPASDGRSADDGRPAGRAAAAVAAVATHTPQAPTPHGALPTVVTDPAGWAAFLDRVATTGNPRDAGFVRAAGHARRLLPEAVHDALVDLADDPGPVAALLVRGAPVGDVPATPPTPRSATGTDGTSELVLLAVARSLGQPVGYEPEHGGEVIQNLLPTREGARRQTSTSSAVELEFHTETAFHPHKPRYLLLICLRGDPAATTLLCSVGEVLDQLPLGIRRVLSEARYRTGVDESFTGARSDRRGRLVPVLSGDPDRPTLTFDADLMAGVDPEAQAALEAFRDLARDRRIGVVLEPGDVLVVDNHACIHGRSAFVARYDGTDRWLQRTFVVSDLSVSAAERDGRVVTTRFA